MASRKQGEMGMKLVFVGLPGQISSIVGAAAFDQRNLAPQYGRPVVGEKAAIETVDLWFQKVSGRTLAQVEAPPRRGGIPNLPRATRNDVNLLLDSLFGPDRPNLYQLLGID